MLVCSVTAIFAAGYDESVGHVGDCFTCSEPLGGEQLTAWYRERAMEIEKLSGQVWYM